MHYKLEYNICLSSTGIDMNCKLEHNFSFTTPRDCFNTSINMNYKHDMKDKLKHFFLSFQYQRRHEWQTWIPQNLPNTSIQMKLQTWTSRYLSNTSIDVNFKLEHHFIIPVPVQIWITNLNTSLSFQYQSRHEWQNSTPRYLSNTRIYMNYKLKSTHMDYKLQHHVVFPITTIDLNYKLHHVSFKWQCRYELQTWTLHYLSNSRVDNDMNDKLKHASFQY